MAFADGRIFVRDDPSRSLGLIETMRRGNLPVIEEEASAAPTSATSR
jgi:hypothetical protein